MTLDQIKRYESLLARLNINTPADAIATLWTGLTASERMTLIHLSQRIVAGLKRRRGLNEQAPPDPIPAFLSELRSTTQGHGKITDTAATSRRRDHRMRVSGAQYDGPA